MIGIYFSGTGNSKYALEFFLKKYDKTAKAYTIEDKNVINHIINTQELIFSYPVLYSNLPYFLIDFIVINRHLWYG